MIEKEENEESSEIVEKNYLKTGERLLSCSQTKKKDLKKRGAKTSFTCTQCGKSLTCKTNLKRHMRIHTREKPFTCDQCGNGFTQSAHLKVHMNIHTREKLHTCDQCGKMYLWAAGLKKHCLKVHKVQTDVGECMSFKSENTFY